MDRTQALIDRIRASLLLDGHSEEIVTESSANGFGDMPSYFEVLIDRKMDGLGEPTAKEVWENMKKQINLLAKELNEASDNYRKLDNMYRGLKSEYKELVVMTIGELP